MESPLISTIWIQVGPSKTKQFLLQAIYRQWQVLGKDESGLPKNQLLRFKKIVDKWVVANNEREVITIGDMTQSTVRVLLMLQKWKFFNMFKKNIFIINRVLDLILRVSNK